MMGHFRKNLITLLMGERCNLGCRYCYLNGNQKKSPKALNKVFAKAGISEFFSHSSPSIRFFGSGEPTLEFDLIKEMWEFGHGIAGDRMYSELQTNGYFASNITDWIGDNISMVWVSCDGPPHIQNFSRPLKGGGMTGTMVQTNIMKMAKRTTVGVRATVASHNVNQQKRMIDYFHSLGVRHVFADHMCLEVGSPGHCSGISMVDPAEFVHSFLEAREYAETKGMFYSNFLIVNFDEECRVACRAMLPVPHLTPSGYVSACDMVDGPTGTGLDVMLYGKWLPEEGRIEYDIEKMNKIMSRKVGNIPGCVDCEVERFCAGGCAGEAINETGDFYGIKKNLCEATKLLARHLGVNYLKKYPILHP